ncbi:C-X-C chemokine receptor type 1 [Ictalurus furcatus]|uniref:C-X-C chemokine receptor type 1 n=1 Tax=Ictalurus furcatus TaxID=66913 RepID=UPI00235043EA|nr:C-X-C chemokine receptor type 1 [Ictalurus furcatus]
MKHVLLLHQRSFYTHEQLLLAETLRIYLLQSEKNSRMANTSNMEEEIYYENYSYPGPGASPCDSYLGAVNSIGVVIGYVVVFFLGIMGNSVVMFVVCTMKKHRTSTDVYLMNLAIADLLFSLTLPFWAIYINESNWVFGTFLCKLISGVQEATFYGCVFLLACISIDRYMAIVKATQFLSKQRHVVRLVCILVWLGAIALSIPIIVQREALEINGNNMHCYENVTAEKMDDWRVGLRVLRHVLGFFFPLTVMAVCYGCTVGTLFHSRNSQKHKAMRVILSVVLAFVICWLPNNVAALVDTLLRGGFITDTCKTRDNLEVTLYVTEALAFMHCAINPILYAFVGKKFRNHLLTLLSKKGLVTREVFIRYRAGSVYSSGSTRHTSVTL